MSNKGRQELSYIYAIRRPHYYVIIGLPCAVAVWLGCIAGLLVVIDYSVIKCSIALHDELAVALAGIVALCVSTLTGWKIHGFFHLSPLLALVSDVIGMAILLVILNVTTLIGVHEWAAIVLMILNGIGFSGGQVPGE